MKKLLSILIENCKFNLNLVVLLLSFNFLLLTFNCFPQGVGVNSTGAPADPSAILDASSTSQGILVPRMTDAQRQALKDPATGLVIYNLSTNEINFYNGAGWQSLAGNSVSTASGTGTGPGGGIGISFSKNAADASAILDVSSTDKGLLIPRTTQQSLTVVTGMIIYNTSTNQINFYDGSLWQVPCSQLIDNIKGTGASGGGQSINETGAAANASAMLDVSSTTKGMLIPRMTSAQRDAIQSPATGLIIYNISDNGIEYWMGSAWHGWVYSPTVSISGNTSICSGSSTTLTANGGGTYLWSDNLGTNASVTVSPVVNTSYTVTVTTSCGIATASVTVLINPLPAPIAGTNTPSATQIIWNWNTVNGATGYKWSTTNDYGSATDNGTSTSFTQTGLTCGTIYTLYVWAYNANCISTYTTLTQSTSACCDTFTTCGSLLTDSRDGKTYRTVLIGTQCWMAENLSYGKYSLKLTPPQASGDKWCFNVNGNPDPTCPMGGLYDWINLMQGAASCNGICTDSINCANPGDHQACSSPVQGLCPCGWHVPSYFEWMQLEKAVCAQSPVGTNCIDFYYNLFPPTGTTEGAKLKSTSSNWDIIKPNCCDLTCSTGGVCNTSGFDALPAGTVIGGWINNLGYVSHMWASTIKNITNGNRYVWTINLYQPNSRVSNVTQLETASRSARCLKD